MSSIEKSPEGPRALRVYIESSSAFIAEIVAELMAASGTRVTPADPESEFSEPKFAWVEVAAVVATVDGIAKLVEAIRQALGRSMKPQVLRMKSTLDIVLLELSSDTTADELHQLLRPLVEPG